MARSSHHGFLHLDLAINIEIQKRSSILPLIVQGCAEPLIWGSHRFPHLKLPGRLLRCTSNDRSGELRKESQRYCQGPILGRAYHPLVEKDGTVFHFMHGGQYPGLGIHVEGQQMKEHIGTVEELVMWWFTPKYNQRQICPN